VVTAWPVAGKRKSADICAAFIRGAEKSSAKSSVFYGVDDSNMDAWLRVKAQREDYFYVDNSYFDVTRSTHFRVTKNSLQHSGLGYSTGDRFRRTRLKIQPWRTVGNHIVVCPQSDQFMRDLANYEGDWLINTQIALAAITVRPLRIRTWDRDKLALSKTLLDDLRGAWALVTYSSAAAIAALIEGIPTISKTGAAAYMGNDLSAVERPMMRDDRERFFGVLADHQFTLDEMAEGRAWRVINGQ